MVQVERHRETAQEHEWLDMEEYDNVVDDLRRKQRAAARRRVEPPHNSTLFGADVPISLSSDDKTALAVVVSGAMSTPGAYHGDGDNNVGPKPTQDQLMDIARLRNVQKNRQHGHSTDRGIIRYHPDTDDNIDDLQARMNGFNSRNDAVEQSEEHRQQLQRKKRRRNMVIGLLVVIVIGAVVGIIVTIIGEKSKETATDGSNSISDVFSNPCASQSDEAMSERYLQLRSLLDVSVPSMAATINAADSNQRVALCWLSELDGLQADVRENKLVQRFLLVAVYLHFVKQAESGDTTATFDLASRNWLTDAHECDWDFIECDEDQKVNALLLNHLGLTGSIPTELTLLSTLEMIELAVNDLTGEVTSGLWSMPKLEQLRLDGNMLRGAIFEGTRSISALKSINIRNNKFTGTLPQNWDMPNLEFFRVANNKFEGMVPDLSTSTKLGEKARCELYCSSF